jgi:hypothetical protein
MSNNEVVVPKVAIATKPKKKLGRPTKESIKNAKAPLGRPKNDTGRMAEFKQRLLGTSGENVIKKIIEIGQTDGHPGQVACLKMAVDRILPMSMFEKDSKGQRNAIQINISGITGVEVAAEEIKDDYEDVDYNEKTDS